MLRLLSISSLFTYSFLFFFFFNDTATTEIYTLSLHDALPICLAFISDASPAAACSSFWPTKCPTPSPYVTRCSLLAWFNCFQFGWRKGSWQVEIGRAHV